METRICCAYNVTRGCAVSSKVTVAHLAVQPLKALKVLLNGLALDSESSLWLMPLLNAPMTLRLFPFDLLYLDAELRVIEGVELLPNVPLPPFGREVASALILPLHRLSASGIAKGDQFLICPQEELEERLREIGVLPRATEANAPSEPRSPSSEPCITGPVRTSTVTPGAGFTVSLSTKWQITSSTVAMAALHETESDERAATPAIAEYEPEKALHSATAVEPEGVVTEAAMAVESACAAPPSIETFSEPSSLPERPEETCEPVAQREQPEAVAGEVLAPHSGRDVPATASAALVHAAAEAAVIADQQATQQANLPARTTADLIARSKAAWERTSVSKSPTARPTAPANARKKAREEKKDHLGSRVIRWLNLEDPLPERRRIIRLLLEGLQAYDANGDTTRHDLRDICPTGFCLKADRKWKRGEIRSVVLQKKGAAEKDREHRVIVPARVIRCDSDGVGLEFAFLEGTEFEPWKRAKTKRSDETEADFILRELRLASALGFLCRLSPGAAEEMKHALLDRLSNKRVAGAVDIALMTEEALGQKANDAGTRAHSDVVTRIIESGSWIEEPWIRQLWAGLLTSSCGQDDQDRSNMPLVDLMARLTPLHLRVLLHVCRRGAEAIAAGQTVGSLRFDFSADELMEAADSHSFVRIQQTIGQLADHGLLNEPARPSYVAMNEKASTSAAPTALGLKMYARLHGLRA